jgi:hypothetical protein
MAMPRVRFTVRRMMAAIGLCAFILWSIPFCMKYWFTWTLLSDVKHGRSTRYSSEAYSQIGPPSVQALRDSLRSNQKTTRLAAIESIAVIGRDKRDAVSGLARPAVPDLIDAALQDKYRDVRIFAAVSLGQIGPAAGAAVEPLIELLRTLPYEEDPQMVLVTIDDVVHPARDVTCESAGYAPAGASGDQPRPIKSS